MKPPKCMLYIHVMHVSPAFLTGKSISAHSLDGNLHALIFIIEMLRDLILGLLRDGKSRHGFGLMTEYKLRSGIRVSTGNFYRELQKLLTEGLIRTGTNPPDADPRRIPYEITRAGKEAFDKWLAGPAAPPQGVHEDELSERLLFLDHAEPGTVERLLGRWWEELWIRNKRLARAREEVMANLASDGKHGSYNALVFLLARRIKHTAADVEFLEEIREEYGRWLERQKAALDPGEGNSSDQAGRSRGKR